MGYRVGIDTGGTFTDIVLLDEETGEIITGKVASTPEDPGLAVLEGLRALGKPPGSIVSLVLGTTTTTNAAVQRKGAAVFYVTTGGFEDVPHFATGRQTRPVRSAVGETAGVGTPSQLPRHCGADRSGRSR
jgi:N-methylhydantoinase A